MVKGLKLKPGKGYTVCIKSTQKWTVAVWRGDHWIESTNLGRIEPTEIECVGVMIKRGRSRLEWFNLLVAQWLFFRVCRGARMGSKDIKYKWHYGLMLFPVPRSGWGTPYKYVADKGPYYIWFTKSRKP